MNSGTPSVGIVLAAYNAAEFIGDTINSIIAQTHAQWQLVVVDDCSTDSTIQLLTQYAEQDERIVVIELSENSGGPAAPRNRGMQIVTGDFIAFIDSDDIWHPQKLEIQLAKMLEEQLNFSSTRLSKFKGDMPSSYQEVSTSSGNSERVNLEKLLCKNVFAASSVMVRSELAETLYFSEHRRHAAVEDYYAWIELHKNPAVRSARLAQRLVYYRIRDDSISRSKIQMAKKIYSLFKELRIDGKPLGARRYAYFLSYLWGAFKSEMFA